MANDRISGVKPLLAETGRLYRALRLGMIADAAADILQEADKRRMMRRTIIVVGTNAMPAYEVELLVAPSQAKGLIHDGSRCTNSG